MIQINDQADFNAVFTPKLGDPGFVVQSKDGSFGIWAMNLQTVNALFPDQSNVNVVPAFQCGAFFKQYAEQGHIDEKTGVETLTPYPTTT